MIDSMIISMKILKKNLGHLKHYEQFIITLIFGGQLIKKSLCERYGEEVSKVVNRITQTGFTIKLIQNDFDTKNKGFSCLTTKQLKQIFDKKKSKIL